MGTWDLVAPLVRWVNVRTLTDIVRVLGGLPAAGTSGCILRRLTVILVDGVYLRFAAGT